MSTSSFSTTCIICCWHWERLKARQRGRDESRNWGEESDWGLQSFGGRRMSHAEEGLEEGLEGGDRNIWDCEKGEAGEDKWHKGFILLRPLWFHFWGWPCKCHVGIPATNHSWNLPQSLCQPPAHPNYLSKPLQLLPAQPSYHSWWCWTYSRNTVRKIQLLFLLCLKYLKLCPEGPSLTIRYFMSHITLIVLLSKQISTFKFQPINRKNHKNF